MTRYELMQQFAVVSVAFAIAACGAAARDSSDRTADVPNPLEAQFADAMALEALEGDATYYADFYEGRLTASGEQYDPRSFTAASPSLPFETVARVVRTDTGASVLVRVNDRTGGGATLIDLSRIAAERLDMIEAGRVPVRLEIVQHPE